MSVAMEDLPPGIETTVAVAGLLAKGLVQPKNGRLELTELGYQLVATEYGWDRGEDQDGDECFMLTTAVHCYSYVATWRELCVDQHLLGPALTLIEVADG